MADAYCHLLDMLADEVLGCVQAQLGSGFRPAEGPAKKSAVPLNRACSFPHRREPHHVADAAYDAAYVPWGRIAS